MTPCRAAAGKRDTAPDFDLAITLASGQVFHWVPQGPDTPASSSTTPVYVEQRGRCLCSPQRTRHSVARYFALDHPLPEIYRTFPADPAMAAALEYCRGMRIIRQPAWECLATFITSSMKQVAHIAQISHTLRSRYGEPVGPGGRTSPIPAPARLAASQRGGPAACALGYRARKSPEDRPHDRRRRGGPRGDPLPAR